MRSNVTVAYIQELRSQGREVSNPGRLIELRRGGVGPDESPGMDAVIAMRTNRVTAEVIREYESLGYDSLDAQTLVAMRIHRVTPGFIREVTELGFPDVPAQLIAMRVWEVTPEYIQKQKALRMKLTIEKLIEMRVIGID